MTLPFRRLVQRNFDTSGVSAPSSDQGYRQAAPLLTWNNSKLKNRTWRVDLSEAQSRSRQHQHLDAGCGIFLVVDLFCRRLEIFRLGKRNVSKSLRITIRQREP